MTLGYFRLEWLQMGYYTRNKQKHTFLTLDRIGAALPETLVYACDVGAVATCGWPASCALIGREHQT